MKQTYSMVINNEKTTSACLWMQAGVVANKPCFKDFECNDCRFDRAMTRVCRENEEARKTQSLTGKKSDAFIFWQDKLNCQPLSRRPCIHHMKGRIDFKACTKSYHCIDCEFDQYFQDSFKVYARVEEINFDKIKGFSLPAGFYLAKNHIWIKIEGNGMVSMGIDDFAARLLGQFDDSSTPLMGKPVKRGKPVFTLGRGENNVTFISPVSGVVTEINAKAKKDPGLINQAPYTDGWLITLFCQDLKQDLKSLMFMDTASEFVDVQAKRLYGYLEEKTGLKAADGGELVRDICGSLPDVSWQELVSTFLSAPVKADL